MNNKIFPCSSLVLDSKKANYTNSTNNHTDAIFRNINFRTLLSDNFELNAKYTISISSFVSYKSAGAMAGGNLNAYKMISSPAMKFKFYSYYKSLTSDFTNQNFWMFPHRYTTIGDSVSYYSEVSMCTFELVGEIADININTYYPNTTSNSSSNSLSYPYLIMCDIFKLKENNNKLQIYRPLMLNNKIISLRLGTTDISTSDTAGDFPLENTIGYIDTMRDELTFKNMNIRQIIGPELFDKYDFFNICLIHTIYSTSQFGTNPVDKLIRIELTGLPWVNNTYVVEQNYNTEFAILGTMKLSTNATALNYSYANVATFRKCDIVNLTIRNIRYEGVYSITTNLFPKIDYYFKIYPAI